MFGSDVVNTFLYGHLTAITAITDTVSDRLYSIDIVPGDLPAGLFHPSTSTYSGPIGGQASSETLTYQVRFICEGTSTAPIRTAAFAQMDSLDGDTFTVTHEGDSYTLSFTSTGETIPTTVFESGTYYRILGTTYEVHVTKG